MPFVVDTSVAASWVLPDEGRVETQQTFDRLDPDYALVPSLWWFEMRNLFVINERRRRIDSERTSAALALLAGLPIRIDTSVDEVALLHLARRHRVTVYDAAYLELAVRRKLPMATLDGALARASRSEGIELIVQPQAA